MSNEEQQRDELEALEAIYGTEVEIVNKQYPNVQVRVNVDLSQVRYYLFLAYKTLSGEHERRDGRGASRVHSVLYVSCALLLRVSASMLLFLQENYPNEEIPDLQINGLEDEFDGDTIDALNERLCSVAQDNLSTPMVFTIISQLQVSASGT